MAEHHTYRDNGMQINLVCCTQVILQDVATKEATQKDVALTYAMAIKSEARKRNDDGIWELLVEAAESIEGLKRNLDCRDAFIGERGLFDDFVKQLLPCRQLGD